MSKTKRLLSMLLVVALVAGIAISGTLAYLTSEDGDVNVMTLGNVEIEQNEKERDGEGALRDFTQDQIVYPAADVDGTKEPIVVNDYDLTIRTGETYMDKIVSVTNTGKSDAYVRTIFAFPEAGDFDTTYNAAEQWFHWNGVSDTDTNPANGWMWGVQNEEGNYIEWPGNEDCWDVVENVEINGKKYDIYVATNKNILVPGASTSPSLMGFYLDPRVDCDGTNYTFIGADGTEYNLGDISDLDILVLSQAVQTAGFDNAWTALDAGFGDVTAENAAKWFEGVIADQGVKTFEEFVAAVKEGGEVVLGADLVYTAEDAKAFGGRDVFTIENKNVIVDLNGHSITVAEDNSYINGAVFFVSGSGGHFAIKGDGAINVENKKAAIVWVKDGAAADVYGGTFTSNAAANEAMFYSQGNGGVINIYGGKYIYELSGTLNGGFNVADKAGSELRIVLYEGVLLNHAEYSQHLQGTSNGEQARIQLADGCKIESVIIDGATWYQVVAE